MHLLDNEVFETLSFGMSGNITVRLLTSVDFPLLRELSSARNTFVRQNLDQDYLTQFDLALDSYLDEKETRKLLFGSFHDGKLVCIAGMFLWKDYPYWSMTNLKTDPSYGRGSAWNGALRACYLEILKTAESRGLYRYFFLGHVRGRTGKGSTNLFQRLIPELNRYEFVIEAYVQAGQEPKHRFEWSLMGERTYNVDVAIYSATLKQAWRPQITPRLARYVSQHI